MQKEILQAKILSHHPSDKNDKTCLKRGEGIKEISSYPTCFHGRNTSYDYLNEEYDSCMQSMNP